MGVGLFDRMVLSQLFLLVPGPGMIRNPAVREIGEGTLTRVSPGSVSTESIDMELPGARRSERHASRCGGKADG